ncbi:peptidoglycan glycosyltransferase [Clostridium thermosuccinogenes]|uniref:Peptidoglycan glycosyltransferase n=1 Tax=Clostridium thermosuccinogenes TaxID=84032 RepID=A0A2K2F344_9CLOT|nr:PASTA domain-containing penicillin-binding protein [Pseudoclostridium thermosuccinogenes]AUS96125.1 peptidoglycan glycosyltransferase [Pseudoclostridium thermosuccinogenes]PNT93192.1 peptidoglycan glycosyltransferase [Pseudoclostridium thermosuccinogenes]PNT98706.1 peptidoglycan glycosyltransferase [Pseudoclostridium thermosuccinogenes]PNU00705.1 peptidoglycan glycosyltransferase [Pseudoclostridium thermosuccinogenes]
MAGTSLSVKKRLLVMLIAFTVFLIALTCRVGWLQIVKGSEYQKLAFEQQNTNRQIPPKRGTIYDRNGKKLAISASVEQVVINPRQVRESSKDIEKTAEELAEILDLKVENVLKKIRKNTGYEIIKRRIDKEIGDQVRKWAKDNKLSGVFVDEDTKRYYPNNNLAAHVIGFTGADNQGLNGIEAIFDDYLKGVPGKILTGSDAVGNKLPFGEEKRIDVQNGLDIVLTIDESIQYFAQKALEKAIADNTVLNGAAAIVTDPRTGEILAMVSKPDFDLNAPFAAPEGITDEEWARMTEDERMETLYKKIWRNKAVVDTYEPGSTFKAITAAAAIEEGIMTPDTPVNDFPVIVQGHKINCWRSYRLHGEETFKEGVYNSCNPVFVRAAQAMGIETFYKYVKAFGFMNRTGVEIVGEAKSIFHEKPVEVDMAVASFGQRFQITPLQLINAYGALANGGKLMKPLIVKEIKDSEGNIVKKYEPEVVRNVISEETSRQIREILEGVVSIGTGKNAYISGYRVAGKTGTSETTETKKNNRYIASFSSFAPADNPVVCVLVILDFPTGPFGHQGGVIAAPVAREILEDTLEYLGVERRYTEKDEASMEQEVYVPDVREKTIAEARKILAQYDLRFKVDGEGNNNDMKVLDQTPKPDVSVPKKSVVVLYTVEQQNQTVKMPDVLNMTVEEATNELNKRGLNIKVIGSGIAVRQEFNPGTQVDKGKPVEVEFRHLDTE